MLGVKSDLWGVVSGGIGYEEAGGWTLLIIGFALYSQFHFVLVSVTSSGLDCYS